jgi:transcriptional regulator GlxA family with amidase domain
VYAAIDHISRSDAVVRDFERHVRANLTDQLSIDAIARTLGTTRRTLERRVRAAAGMTPLELIQRIRAERAEHLLATTEQSIDQVAAIVGYRNGSTLRALLRRYRHRG